VDDSTLLSIKDFSKLTGIQQSALRYYDKIGLFSPAARGDNNYRFYTPVQLFMLKFINVLAELGIPLTKIKDLIDKRTPENVIDLLGHHVMKLDSQMHRLRISYSIIHAFRNNIQKGLLANKDEIRVEELDEFRMVHGPVNDFKGNDTFYQPFLDFCHSAEKNRINLHYPVGAYHYNMDTFLTAPGEPNKFFSLDPFGDAVCPAGTYLVGYARGYYGNLGDIAQRMSAYAEGHRLTFKGAVYVMYLFDEISMASQSDYLARAIVGVS
jgi:DNA-binding transcriptional MerR regulator